MRNSKVLSKLHNSEIVFCLKSIYAEPDIVEMMGYMGVDVVWICNEHIAIDPEKLKMFVVPAVLAMWILW